jgi:hypothetical protein
VSRQKLGHFLYITLEEARFCLSRLTSKEAKEKLKTH